MRLTIQTPNGSRAVPDWAKCHCVSRHSPNYIHPYPFALPSGDELWLCPNTYHQAMTLLSMYKKLDGPPARRDVCKFNYFVRQLIKLYWQQILEEQVGIEAYNNWKKSLVEEDDWGLFEAVKKVDVDA